MAQGKEPHPLKVHVWGCFSAAGVGEIEIFEENMDRFVLMDIFKKRLTASYQKHFPSGMWYFQQDNDKKHHALIVQEWLFSKGIQCLDWPPYSPDLNPIENLWAILKRRVAAHNPTTTEELKAAILTEWHSITPSQCARLVKSMPARCQAVLNNGGNMTKY
jgi:hypothetical protein